MQEWLASTGFDQVIFDVRDGDCDDCTDDARLNKRELTVRSKWLIERFHQRITRGDSAITIIIEECKGVHREVEILLLVVVLVEHYGYNLTTLNPRLRGWKNKGYNPSIGQYFDLSGLRQGLQVVSILPPQETSAALLQERLIDAAVDTKMWRRPVSPSSTIMTLSL